MARIDLEGMEELNALLERMTLTEEDERKTIKLALVPIENEVIKNTPVLTKKLQGSVKSKIVKEDGQIVGKVVLGKHYGVFQEYGTSHQNKNRGFFARSVRAGKSEALNIMKKEIFKRVK